MATSAPVTSAKEADSRLSREQTSRSAADLEKEWDEWTPMAFTQAPPALENFEQRWVRVRLGGNDDVQNFLKRTRQGWMPRPASTLPAAYLGLKATLGKDRFGDHGDLIGNQDCILMHRPTRIGNQMRQQIKDSTQRLSNSIKAFVSEQMPVRHGTRGGSVEELSIRAPSVSGRTPMFAEDCQ